MRVCGAVINLQFFEDHIAQFMQEFHNFLIFRSEFADLVEGVRLAAWNVLRRSSDVDVLHLSRVQESDEAPGILHQVQAQVCENVCLYTEKYEEQLKPYLGGFVQDVWTLLVEIQPDEKFDQVCANQPTKKRVMPLRCLLACSLASIQAFSLVRCLLACLLHQLVSAGIKFLSSVSKSVHWEFFSNVDTLRQVCERIVIPNMRFTDSDESNFEENPIEYIRRDIEGSSSCIRNSLLQLRPASNERLID